MSPPRSDTTNTNSDDAPIDALGLLSIGSTGHRTAEDSHRRAYDFANIEDAASASSDHHCDCEEGLVSQRQRGRDDSVSGGEGDPSINQQLDSSDAPSHPSNGIAQAGCLQDSSSGKEGWVLPKWGSWIGIAVLVGGLAYAITIIIEKEAVINDLQNEISSLNKQYILASSQLQLGSKTGKSQKDDCICPTSSVSKVETSLLFGRGFHSFQMYPYLFLCVQHESQPCLLYRYRSFLLFNVETAIDKFVSL